MSRFPPVLRTWLAKYGTLLLTVLGMQVWIARGVPSGGVLLATVLAFGLGALLFTGLPAAVRWVLRYDEPDASAQPVRPRHDRA